MSDIGRALSGPPPAPPKPGETLVVASHNPGKVREIGDLLRPLGLSAVSAGDRRVPEPDETETTFEGNAALKALHAAQAAGLPALADDSGLCVDALGGDPGIHSARWGGPAKDFALAMETVEAALQKVGAKTPEARGAHFVCVLAFARPGGACAAFRGEVHGRLVWPPRGTKGFGYDPVFMAEGMDMTFGEMEPDAKHAISHRAKAFDKLLAAWGAGTR